MCLPAAKVGRNATVSCVCADNQQLKSDMRSCEASAVTIKPTGKTPVTTKLPVTRTSAETTQPTTKGIFLMLHFNHECLIYIFMLFSSISSESDFIIASGSILFWMILSQFTEF